MAINIEASIKGNVGSFTPNVVNGRGKIDPAPKASGFSKVISDNNARVAGEKSVNVKAVQPKDARSTISVLLENAKETKGLSEFNKGLNFSARP